VVYLEQNFVFQVFGAWKTSLLETGKVFKKQRTSEDVSKDSCHLVLLFRSAVNLHGENQRIRGNNKRKLRNHRNDVLEFDATPTTMS